MASTYEWEVEYLPISTLEDKSELLNVLDIHESDGWEFFTVIQLDSKVALFFRRK